MSNQSDGYGDNYWLRRAGSNRLSRRRFVAAAGAVSASVAFSAACGSKTRKTTGGASATTVAPPTVTTGKAVPGASEQPKRGGTFTFAEGGSPRTLDPHFDTFPANTIVTNNVYNSLLTFTPDLTKIVPELATALPEQPDPLSFVFKLQQGVKYQNVAPANGREMTSADVKYSIERQMTNQAGKFQHAYFFLNKLASIETPDKYTIKFTTMKPYAPFISYMASPWTQVILRELVEADGDLTKRAVGTGPFIFDEWQKDVQIKLHRNPDYWRKDAMGGQLPYIDNLVINLATDANAIQALFVNGDVMAAGIQFTFTDQVQKKVPKANYRIQPSQFWREMRTPPWDGVKYMQRKPYDDIRVRQAVVQAVNKKEVLDTVLSGDGVLVNGPIIPVYTTWALKEDPAKFDIADAKKLLEAAGQGSGYDEEMIFASDNAGDIASQVGEVLKAQLAKIGVRVTLRPMDTASYYNKTYSYDYTLSHHIPLNNPDPDENLSSYFGQNGTFYKWGNKDIWAMIDQQSQTLDQTARQQIVQDVQRKIVLDYPMAFIYAPNNHFFTSSKVKGWFFANDLYNGRLEPVWLDPSA
ncbi:MAG: ABC transporter substrate-binding protein [Dehalococcoidia bacterium]